MGRLTCAIYSLSIAYVPKKRRVQIDHSPTSHSTAPPSLHPDLSISYPVVHLSFFSYPFATLSPITSHMSSFSAFSIYRYGPWVLLCKNRSASFSVLSYDDNSSSLTHSYSADEENMDHEIFQPTWEQYGDGATVESIGLTNGAALMFEYCLFKKDGKV